MKVTTLSWIFAISAMAGSTCSASLISNGSFEFPDVPAASPYGSINYGAGDSIGAWRVTGGPVTISPVVQLNGVAYGGVATDGKQYIDFNGGDTTPGTAAIHQSFGTVVGGTYTVTFDVGRIGWAPGVIQLSAQALDSGNVINGIIGEAKAAVGGYDTYSFTFKARSGWTTLNLADASLATSSVDLLLDNVRVEGPTPVPEPSTVIAGALLLLPFGVSAFRSLRKNRA